MIYSLKPYRYEKALPGQHTRSVSRSQIVAFSFVFVGVLALGSAFLPAVLWQFTGSSEHQLFLPLALSNANRSAGLVLGETDTTKTITVKKLSDGFSYFGVLDNGKKKAGSSNRPRSFSLTIPKLKITNARTVVDSSIFDKNLGHLPGTALPGEVGNVFITGHSSLPQLFSQDNYKTIFSYLPKLDVLDTIEVTMNGKLFTYTVEKRFVVDPSDTSVIDPPDPFGKYLTLMTCVPPGLNTKRLIVLARLVE